MAGKGGRVEEREEGREGFFLKKDLLQDARQVPKGQVRILTGSLTEPKAYDLN